MAENRGRWSAQVEVVFTPGLSGAAVVHRSAAERDRGPKSGQSHGTLSVMSPADLTSAADDRWFGVFSFAELTRRGMGQSQVTRMAKSGDLRPLRRGWYATPYADSRVVEAVAANGVCSCVTALDLHDVWVPPHGKRVHVRSRESGHRNGRAARFCRRYGRPLPEIYPVDDVLTALAHAIKCLDAEGIIAVCDSILHRGLAEMCDLREVFAAAPERVRKLLERCDDRAESGTESIMRLRLLAMGLSVAVQVTIQAIGRVDLVVGRRLIIELDSIEFHDLSPEQREADRIRDEMAHRLGYLPLRFSYKRVMFAWDEVAETLTAILRRGDHLRAPAAAADYDRSLVEDWSA